jgi:hypothetical protein
MRGLHKGWRDFLQVCARLLKGVGLRVGQQRADAKIMTARSPNDNAGEHNKGSGFT